MEKLKNGKIRKQVFIYFSAVIIILLAYLLMAFNTRKVKAGVIVETEYEITDVQSVNINNSENMFCRLYYSSSSSGNYQILNCQASALYNETTLNSRIRVVPVENWNTYIPGTYRVDIYIGSPGRKVAGAYLYVNTDLELYLDLHTAYIYLAENISDLVFNIYTPQQPANYIYFYKSKNIISSIDNIYDLKQNDVALIYLSDLSELSTSGQRDEITINWGYIDASDNTVYAVNAPKVSAEVLSAQDMTVRLGVPNNATGSSIQYYDISQRALLSTISGAGSTGGATATAHIYGLYVWLQANRIQWGLAEFDTTSTPASGASMNYITSLTSMYDYTAVNTSTMTCRLSISDNFNFITIKNQAILSANNINTVIRQGGFLPAWAVYNWARGSSAGYTSGYQAGSITYQPGNEGYETIYQRGYNDGVNANVSTVNWFVSSFQAVDAFLNIRIFPNITFGYLLGIPFIISLVWFIIRMFRGGGGNN